MGSYVYENVVHLPDRDALDRHAAEVTARKIRGQVVSGEMHVDAVVSSKDLLEGQLHDARSVRGVPQR